MSTSHMPAAEKAWLPSVAAFQRRFYPDVNARNPVAMFTRRLQTSVKATDDVLDLGAGAGELNGHALKGRVRRIVGVDLDPRVVENPLLDAGLQADIFRLPFRDGSFDVVFSIYVLEHVEQPSALTEEIFRVLRPGGRCLMLTPNLFHYVAAVARVTPTSFHKWINERRGRRSEDTFRTFYRMNSSRALRRHFGDAGFRKVAIDAIEVQPNYLAFNPLAFALGVAFERLVNATDLLAGLRVNLIAEFEKPAR